MHVILAALSACVLLAFADASAAQTGAVTEGVSVVVSRDGDRWTADYALDRQAPVWAFERSALTREGRQPWRLQQWTVETPGVVLERQGTRDVLRATEGGFVPRDVRLTMRPAAADIEADYSSLVFSDGSVALFSGQFNVFPLASIEEARALPIDLSGVAYDGGPASVTWRDQAGPVLFKGDRHTSVTAVDAEAYVLFGRAGLVESDRLATVIDPALPEWISTEISEFAPRIADIYAARLGSGPAGKPTVMVSWSGPTPELRSMGGSVLPGLIVMTFEGVGVVESTPAVQSAAHWFIGHESAHFWLGQVVRYERAQDAWITEGGADLMAIRSLQMIDADYDARAELQKAVDDCVQLSRDKPVANADERGEHRAYYACGAVWAMAAEGAVQRQGGVDWFDFLKPLLDANRQDGIVSRADWLNELVRVSGDPSLRVGIERMLDEGMAEPAAGIASLFERTGVEHLVEGGRVVLI